MSMTRSKRTTMSRALARSSSVSLVLPLAPQQQSTILYSLRRAQSSIPAAEISQAGVDLSRLSKSHQRVFPARDVDQDSFCSDYTSCSSSVAEYLEAVEEPQRVSKDILRSLSTSFRWLEVPFHEIELPFSRLDIDKASSSEQKINPDTRKVRPAALKSEIKNYTYIHECRTGGSLLNHVDLKTAMDSLQHWAMQVPRNCCLSYKHDDSGEVATLPWPDLEAGGPEEIEEFVRTVNRVEGEPVFFPRYERSPYYSAATKVSTTLSAMSACHLEEFFAGV